MNELRPWMPWATSLALEAERDFAERAALGWERDDGWAFVALLDGEVSGTVGLHAFEPAINLAELGYWIRSDVCGRGLATEAASAVVAFGFEELGLHRIDLFAGCENQASVRVAEKVGFVREGLARRRLRGEDYYDAYMYGLLATDARLID